MSSFHIFSKNISIYAIFNDQSFNDTLTNDIVSFEQLGPEWYTSRIIKKCTLFQQGERSVFFFLLAGLDEVQEEPLHNPTFGIAVGPHNDIFFTLNF